MTDKKVLWLEAIAAALTLLASSGFVFRAISDWQQLKEVPVIAAKEIEDSAEIKVVDAKIDLILGAMDLKYDNRQRNP